MSTDSEELISPQQLQDDTIITVRGSSEDVTTTNESIESPGGDDDLLNEDDAGELGSDDDGTGGDGSNNAVDDDGGESMDTSEPVSTPDPPGGSSGDINTDDLTEFEKSMKKLEVTGGDGGPKIDSGKRTVNTQVQTSANVAESSMSQLFETCSMIQTRQNSNFPVKPPASCLMDAQTVSVTVMSQYKKKKNI